LTASRAVRLASTPALRFLLVGLSNNAIGFAVLWLGVHLPFEHRFKAGVAQLCAYAIGGTWSFLWNRRWTFRSTTSPVRAQAWRFDVSQVTLGLASAALVSLAVDQRGWPVLPSWLVVTALITVANFAVCRLWVFR